MASGLNPQQLSVAQQIVAEGQREGLSPNIIVGGIDAGIAESSLTNLPGGDADSKGVFQQRPSQGYGTVNFSSVADEAKHFFANLVHAPGPNLPEQIANTQRPRSDLRHIYADNLARAASTYTQITGQSFDIGMAQSGPAGDTHNYTPNLDGATTAADPTSSPVYGILKSLDAVLNVQSKSGIIGEFESVLNPINDLRVIVSRGAIVLAGAIVGAFGLVVIVTSIGRGAESVADNAGVPVDKVKGAAKDTVAAALVA